MLIAMRKPYFVPAVAALVIVISRAASAQSIVLQPVASGVANVVTIADAGDGSGRLFLVQQSGQIRVYNGASVLPTPFLDISSRVLCCGERGLLGLAFHPLYENNGAFYVFYTNPSGDLVIARYLVSADPNRADAATEALILTVPHPTFGNHNGGQLQFGPDGHLYIATGDGGGGGDPDDNAQDLGSLLGKILRVEVGGGTGYTIPADNPFIGTAGARAEIWAYGLRNPWRFSFDRLTGDLLIADVGQSAREEIDFEASTSSGGTNYGWPCMEGTAPFRPPEDCGGASLTPPILEYTHAFGCSVTGGYRYRGAGYPSLYGLYFYSDFCSGRIWAASPDGSGNWTTSELVDTPLSVASFGQDQAGELYLADYSGGVLYRITADSHAPRYRLYHDGTKEHLYTTDLNEYTVLGTRGWIQEGVAHQIFLVPAPYQGVTPVPLYRLYHPGIRQHHWTTDANEWAVLSSSTWTDEGISGYVLPVSAAGSTPLYRLALPNPPLHLWTTDLNEYEVLQTRGWVAEGIAGWVLP